MEGRTAGDVLPIIDYRDLLWLAGVVEGEGYLYIHPTRQVWRGGIRVGMTDEDIVRRCRDVTGLGTVTISQTTATGRPYWSWNVNRRDDCARLLLALYPLMGTRRRQRIAEMTDKICATYRENGRYHYRRRGTGVTV